MSPVVDPCWQDRPPDTAGWDRTKPKTFWVKPYGKTKPAQVAVVGWDGKEWRSDALLTWDGRWQDMGRLAMLSIWWYGPIEPPEGP